MNRVVKTIRWIKGKRLGQTIPSTKRRVITDPRTGRRVTIPPGHYIKGGKMFKYSAARDRARKAQHRRSRGSAKWRGDWWMSRI